MYATEADLKARFGDREVEQLKSMYVEEQNNEASEEESVDLGLKAVSIALADAEEEINGYIGGRYSLPLPNIPSNLNRIACDIARYRLYFQQPTEHVSKLYDDAIAFLKRVQDKRADLQIIDQESKEIINEQPQNKPSTVPIGTTYTGGVFGDSILDKMPTL
jgi:phage gp36-like protein